MTYRTIPTTRDVIESLQEQHRDIEVYATDTDLMAGTIWTEWRLPGATFPLFGVWTKLEPWEVRYWLCEPEPKRCKERMRTRDGAEHRCMGNEGWHEPLVGCIWGRDD